MQSFAIVLQQYSARPSKFFKIPQIWVFSELIFMQISKRNNNADIDSYCKHLRNNCGEDLMRFGSSARQQINDLRRRISFKKTM